MNILKSLFKKLNENKIKYSIDKKFGKKFPEFEIPKGTNELGYIEPAPYPKDLANRINFKIEEKSLSSFHKTIRNLGFISFPNKNSYFKFDKNLGLLNIYVPNKENTKSKLAKGRLICFVGPEGGGKTTTLSVVYTALENFPIEKRLTTFSSFKDSRLWRIYDLGKKLLAARFKGNKLILTDRYIYLTFRKNKFFRKILKFGAVEPDIVFIMKSNYKTLKKRKGPICSSKEKVEEMYGLFNEAKNKIEIDATRTRKDNLELIMNNILKLYGAK